MQVEMSIIVPVYNLEALLPRCVESILSQTFTNFELILVNDGSPDNSGRLCEEYAAVDNRVKVIHKENGGIASARNTGLEAAQGTFVGFVDNDDYVNHYMFETLYNNALKYCSDIVICDFLKVNEYNKHDTKSCNSTYKIEHFNSLNALNQLYTDNNLIFVCPWNKLYKRSLFKNVRYWNGFYNDDETVIHELLFKSKLVTYVQKQLYYYVQREGSITNSYIKNRLDIIYALKDRSVFFKRNNLRDLHQKALIHYMERFFWYYLLAKENVTDIDHELKKLKKSFDQSLIHLLKLPGISFNQKTMCMIFSLSPPLFDAIRRVKVNHRQKEAS